MRGKPSFFTRRAVNRYGWKRPMPEDMQRLWHGNVTYLPPICPHRLEVAFRTRAPLQCFTRSRGTFSTGTQTWGAQTIRVRVFAAFLSARRDCRASTSRRPHHADPGGDRVAEPDHIGNFGRINGQLLPRCAASGTDYRDLAAIGVKDRHRPAGGRSVERSGCREIRRHELRSGSA